MSAWLKAGLAYGAIIFALGFVLGAAREMVLAPLFGRDMVVLVEGPLILLASWIAAILLVLRHKVAATVPARLAMGATAFILLLSGEALVAVFGLGRSLSMHLSAYATQRGVLELMPQVAFALFPVVHLFREARP